MNPKDDNNSNHSDEQPEVLLPPDPSTDATNLGKSSSPDAAGSDNGPMDVKGGGAVDFETIERTDEASKLDFDDKETSSKSDSDISPSSSDDMAPSDPPASSADPKHHDHHHDDHKQLGDNPNITVDSAEDPEEAAEHHKHFDIKPAPPAPGSIGSAKSGAQDVAPHHMPHIDSAAQDPAPTHSPEELIAEAATTPPANPPAQTAFKSASNQAQGGKAANTSAKVATVFKVLLVVLLLVVIGLIGYCLIMSPQNSRQQANQQPQVTTVTKATLVCSADRTAKANEAGSPATKVKNTKTFTYTNNQLSDLTDLTQYTFADVGVLTEQKTNLQNNYQTAYTSAGLTADPFVTEFAEDASAGAVINVKHDVTIDQVNAKTAPLINLTLDDSGQVITDPIKLQQLLDKEQYVCADANRTDATATTNNNK